jgi:alpha-tubulin suppressor-like RCC1 family protein
MVNGVCGFVSDVFVSDVASSTSAYVVTKEGSVWVSGKNNHGQLGTGSTTDIAVWTKITTISGRIVSIVSSGYSDTWNAYAITDDRNLWVTGFNSDYTLGTGTDSMIQQWTKVEVGGLSGHVRKVSASSGPGNYPNQAYAITDDGNLFVTGTFSSSIAANPFGAFKSPVASWTKVPDANLAGHVSDIVSVLHNYDVASAYVITDQSYLYVTGNNMSGQLGLGHSNHVSVWTKIEGRALAGKVHSVSGSYSGGTFVITHSGDLFVAGQNAHGQFGLGDTANRNSWTKVEAEGLRGNAIAAKVMSWNSRQSTSAIVVTSSNDLFVAGKNGNGELGLGNTAQQLFWKKVTTPGLSGKVKI